MAGTRPAMTIEGEGRAKRDAFDPRSLAASVLKPNLLMAGLVPAIHDFLLLS
jgi:hypothetical protein